MGSAPVLIVSGHRRAVQGRRAGHGPRATGHGNNVRELRPQAGKSPWRPLYRSVGARFIISAIGPEAKKDRRGFDKACQRAIDRLTKLEDDTKDQDTNQDQNETS